MSFPLGVVAYPALVTDSLSDPDRDRKRSAAKALGQTSTTNERFGSFLFKRNSTSPKSSSSGRSSPVTSKLRSFTSFRKQGREPRRSTTPPAVVATSNGPPTTPPSPHDSFDLTTASHKHTTATRSRHIPILIPNQSAYVTHDNLGPSPAASTTLDQPRPSDCASLSTIETYSSVFAFAPPQHVELSFPHWPAPVSLASRKACSQSFEKPDLAGKDLDLRLHTQHSSSPSFSSLVFGSLPCEISHDSFSAAVVEMTDSINSLLAQDRSQSVRPNHGAQTNLHNMPPSQTSFSSISTDADSASEAESVSQDEMSSSRRADDARTPQVTQSSTTNLSGLVCNVHRTTGREPPPLVGATTTILGDKLYVFGGRRVSRTRSQLTANIYELDLVRRHWTKLETKGDIPPPRYFHSVCPLGDTKLVCYGGMSPSPSTELSADAQPEVVVMSDVHIYDVTTMTWVKITTADAPQGRYAHCAAILPSGAVFSSATAPMSAVHHNPSSGADPNSGSLGVTLDGTGGAEMVIVGGQDSANHYIEQVSVFNLRSLKWTGTTGMGRSCGAYRSVVTPLTTMKAANIGAGPQAQLDDSSDDDQRTVSGISGAPMLIYSNYNFLDVKLELQVRLTDGTLTEKAMETAVSPPGLRFPNGGIIANHFVVSGTFLTSSKQEYALWALDLTTLTWSRIDAGGSIFSQGSWNRGLLWSRRNAFVVLGNRKRSLVDDYNNRRINFSNMCIVELEAFGLYENPRSSEPTSSFHSPTVTSSGVKADPFGRLLSSAAEEFGAKTLGFRELADMDFLSIENTRIPVNSRLIARRWGSHFTTLLRESMSATNDPDTATLRPSISDHTSRNSSITITPSVDSNATTLTNNTNGVETPAHPSTRPRIFYLPHTTPTLHALLHYLYTSALPAAGHPLATPQILCSLLQIARPYKIDGLLEAVVERLHECLDGRNAAAIFNAAAMGAGGGQSIQSGGTSSDASSTSSKIPYRIHHSSIPPRTASLAGLDNLVSNGSGSNSGRASTILRIDTGVANNTLPGGKSQRPGAAPRHPSATGGETDDDDQPPGSAATDTSMSDIDFALSPASLTGRRSDRDRDAWSGSLSAVVGLQKRGLRGLMEGRRMRERGRNEVSPVGAGVGPADAAARVGLGIA